MKNTIILLLGFCIFGGSLVAGWAVICVLDWLGIIDKDEGVK